MYKSLAGGFLEPNTGVPAAQPIIEPMPPLERIGLYTVLQLLGAGGMGQVYQAHDERLERDVAIKFLPRPMTTDALALDRFQREARAASAFNHPDHALSGVSPLFRVPER